KATLAANVRLPTEGKLFLSVRDEDKPAACEIARRLRDAGLEIIATKGTRAALAQVGLDAAPVDKVGEGRPNIVDRLADGEFAMVLNTSSGAQAIRDSRSLRRQTLMSGVPYCTTIAAAAAAVEAVEAQRSTPLSVRSLQEYHGTVETQG